MFFFQYKYASITNFYRNFSVFIINEPARIKLELIRYLEYCEGVYHMENFPKLRLDYIKKRPHLYSLMKEYTVWQKLLRLAVSINFFSLPISNTTVLLHLSTASFHEFFFLSRDLLPSMKSDLKTLFT